MQKPLVQNVATIIHVYATEGIRMDWPMNQSIDYVEADVVDCCTGLLLFVHCLNIADLLSDVAVYLMGNLRESL